MTVSFQLLPYWGLLWNKIGPFLGILQVICSHLFQKSSAFTEQSKIGYVWTKIDLVELLKVHTFVLIVTQSDGNPMIFSGVM